MTRHRRTLLGLALFTTFSLLATWLVFTTVDRGVSGPTSTYTAVFTDVSGLAVGDDVRVAGVRIGRVDAIELVDNQAQVTFRTQQSQTLYSTTLASVTYQNVIGQRYLGLSDRGGQRQILPAGGRIAHTTPSFDISTLLNGFEPLFTELDPDQVNNLTNAIVLAFQGGRGSLASLTSQASHLAATLAGPDQSLAVMITDLDALTAAVVRQADALESILAQSHHIVADIAQRREGLLASMASITGTLDKLGRIVAAITPDVQALVGREPGFLQHGLNDGRARFAYMAANLPLLLKGLARITQEGSYVNAYACDVDFGLWQGLLHWFRAFVIAATPGAVDAPRHSPVCR
ncbi:MlaD family protein [Arthrobacter sp. SLBN-53]|uniref:MlaD family protein n=1 Tax=Arthrobacter sp. SLBN-53 TaxID=2768412 RepID=UPI001152BCBA|nr:MlaD family protein [Arthrobacter sp. SLBN-53]TQK32060.1 phospholipid/cholesterol/gamma-HCH transport system substrate-binding protein [Arthrobacter sp. SLBN-53]